jgi:hypothetical protein
MKKVVNVGFYFENCDYISIPVYKIQHFNLGSISEGKSFYKEKNSLYSYKTISDVVFYFDKSIEELSTELNKDLSVVNKFRQKDITKILIYYDDKTLEDYYVQWKDSYILDMIDDQYNDYQNFKFDKYEKCYILTIDRSNDSKSKVVLD